MPTKRRKKSYSRGEMNRLIDAVIHPFYRKNQCLRLLDEVVHALIEQNPRVSAKKFIEYNLPDIVKEILKRL